MVVFLMKTNTNNNFFLNIFSIAIKYENLFKKKVSVSLSFHWEYYHKLQSCRETIVHFRKKKIFGWLFGIGCFVVNKM